MSVADMDFRAPTPIIKALRKAVDHGVLGYELISTTLKESIAARMFKLYKWKIKPEEVIPVAGVVSGYSAAAHVLCSPKKGYLIQSPVYNEFHEVAKNLHIVQLDAHFIKTVNSTS